MSIREWRRTRADRRAVRAELSSGEGWLEYRRQRRASKRAMRAERKGAGRTGGDIEPDKNWAQTFQHGSFGDNPPPR
jgi:hypothetical protein